MIAGRLEAILIGNVRDGDQLTVGRRIRIRAGLHDNLLLLLLAGGRAVGGQHRHQDLLQEALTAGLNPVARLVAVVERAVHIVRLRLRDDRNRRLVGGRFLGHRCCREPSGAQQRNERVAQRRHFFFVF